MRVLFVLLMCLSFSSLADEISKKEAKAIYDNHMSMFSLKETMVNPSLCNFALEYAKKAEIDPGFTCMHRESGNKVKRVDDQLKRIEHAERTLRNHQNKIDAYERNIKVQNLKSYINNQGF